MPEAPDKALGACWDGMELAAAGARTLGRSAWEAQTPSPMLLRARGPSPPHRFQEQEGHSPALSMEGLGLGPDPESSVHSSCPQGIWEDRWQEMTDDS